MRHTDPTSVIEGDLGVSAQLVYPWDMVVGLNFDGLNY